MGASLLSINGELRSLLEWSWGRPRLIRLMTI
jgi:hypothetical protein